MIHAILIINRQTYTYYCISGA